MNTSRSLFESLYHEHHAMVQQMCLGFMKGDRELAHDLTQEVFINTWHALAGFRQASSYKTWIYRVTVNTCLQYIRKNKNKRHVSLPGHFDVPETANPADENHVRLYRAIGRLPEVDRLICMMVLDEVDYTEMATVMGLQETNLRVKIHRIKKRLKELLEYEH